MQKDFNTVDYLIEVVTKATHSVYAVTFSLLVFCVNYLAPERLAFTIVLVAVLIDALFGILVSWKHGNFILSELGRRTFLKLSAYYCALILIFLCEKLAHDEGFIAVKVASAWAVACEFWSFSAHVLILNPNAVFFRVARKHLQGEMQKKTGYDLDAPIEVKTTPVADAGDAVGAPDCADCPSD